MGGQRPILVGEVTSMVTQYNGIGAMLGPQWGPPSGAVQSRDEQINEHVTVRVYTPNGAEGERLPLGVYFHGGGYIAGNLEFEDPICRIIAENTPCIVVAVDYRLAPGFKLPTGINDGYDAFLWAHEKAGLLGADPNKVFSVGGSAGGGLALSVADKLIREGRRDLIKGVVALNPITTHFDNPPEKYKDIYTSCVENATGVPIIDLHCMNVSYESSAAQPTDATVFVSISPNLTSYPPIYIATCEKDILRDDGIVLEHMLQDAGVKTKRDHYIGFPHYFFVFPSLPTGKLFLQNVVKGVRFVLGTE
ncbi:lipase 2 [Phlyctema vagabunda]|uniref:Lipase 2 n=1 Tax=Phlyctema vagabunda TaxID=108571 RepID=A0ABR4P4K7_9HELO